VDVQDGVIEAAHGHGRLLFAKTLYPPESGGTPS